MSSIRYPLPASARMLFLLLLSLVAGFRQAAAQATITVDSAADVLLAGDGACTLREAIRNANDDADTTGGDCAAGSGNDTVVVPAGTYVLALAGSGDDGGDLDLRGTLTITGAGQSATILDADGLDRVLEVQAGATVVLEDLTVTGGATSGNGGGIRSDGTLTLNRCAVRDNTAAANGGGILNAGARTLRLNDSTVDGNDATHGGGIFSEASPSNVSQTRVFLSRSTLSANKAINQGGGLNAFLGNQAEIRNSTFSGNAAAQGGGIWMTSSTGVMGATTFLLANSTVVGNTASTTGGGLLGNALGVWATTAVRNSVFAGNTGPGGAANDCTVNGGILTAPFTSGGYNVLSTDGTACGFTAATDRDELDLLLGALADNGGPTQTHLPQPGSPAVDAANDATCESTDQRGHTRPVDADQNGTATCDAGAVELLQAETGAYVDVALALSASLVAPGTGNQTTFTVTVRNDGTAGATGLGVTALLPAGSLAYVSDAPAAGTTYDPGTGVWTVGDLAAHTSTTLAITATYTSTAAAVFTAEVTALDQDDPDASDDQAQATILPPPYGAGTALSFDGTNDYVGFTTTPANLPAGGASYTLEAWFKPDQMGNYGLLGWGQYGTANQVIALRLTTTGLRHYWWGNDLTVTTGNLSSGWHHVAVTYDGTTRALYLDGVLAGSDTPGTHAVPDGRNFRIGSTNNAEFFDGRIDEVRVWSTARTQAQLQADMNRTLLGGEAGLVGYWRFDAGTGTAALDYAASHHVGTLQGPSWAKSGAALGQTGAFAGPGSDPNAVGPHGGSMTADLTSTPGVEANLGLYFSGTLDGDPVTGEAFAVELTERLNPVWGVFARGTNTADLVLDYSDVDGIPSPDFVNLLRRTNAASAWTVVTAEWVHDPVARTFTKTGAVTFGEFALVTFVTADLSLSASVDDDTPAHGQTVTFTITLVNHAADPAAGVQVSIPLPAGLAYASDVPEQGTYTAGSGLWDVGTLPAGGEATLVLQATAQGAATFKATISAAEVIDPTPGNDTVQAQLFIPATNAGNRVAFNGGGDYVRIANESRFDFTAALTVEAWIRPTFDVDWMAVVAKGDGTWRLHRNGSSNTIAFGTRAAGDLHDLVGTTNVADGQWHHVAAVFAAGEKRLYVDGRLEASHTLLATNLHTTDDAVDIGYNSAFPLRRYRGLIDEVRLWNVARTAGELRETMHRTLDGDEAGLVGYWRFDESGGTTIHDYSAGATAGSVIGSLAFGPSTAPFGPGTSTIATVSADGPVSFAGTGLTLAFTGVTGSAHFVVTRLDQPPGGTPPTTAGGQAIYETTDAYWILDRIDETPPFTGTTDFTFVLGPGVAGGDPADLKLLRRADNSDGNWSIAATAVSVDPATGTIVFEDVPCCSQYLIGSTSEDALPVELVSFTAVADGEAVLLRWATTSETGNAGFEVEARPARLEEPAAWHRLAFVGGHGTTSEMQTYTYRAASLEPGRYVFRLKQIDFDGATHYSPEVEGSVELAQAYRLTPAYPNPFAAASTTFTLAVRRAQMVSIEVYDGLGRRVAVLFDGTMEAGQHRRFVWEAGAAAAGLYFIRARGEDFAAVQRVLRVR